MLRPLVLLAVIVALAVGVATQPATAQEGIDISGEWLVDGFRVGLLDECAFTISQAGTLLAAAAECESGIQLHGSIDPTNGEFSLSGRSRISREFEFAGTATNEQLSFRLGQQGVRRPASSERQNSSGNWTAHIIESGAKHACSMSTWQRDETLAIELDCGSSGTAQATGGVDLATGLFSVSGEIFGSQGDIEGFASRTGRALSAVFAAPSVGSGTITAFLEQQTGGVLQVDCDGATEGIQASCAYDVGETFPVQVHLTDVPPQEFNGFQLNLRWTAPQLSYIRSEFTEDELLEADCELGDRGVSVPSRIVSFVCLNPPVPDAESHQVGVPVEVTMKCLASGSGTLTQDINGSTLLLNGGLRSTPQIIHPVTIDATVWCRPSESSQPGDVNCNGLVNSIDALLILQLESTPSVVLPCPDKADMNRDGAVNSIDAALILQYALGLWPG